MSQETKELGEKSFDFVAFDINQNIEEFQDETVKEFKTIINENEDLNNKYEEVKKSYPYLISRMRIKNEIQNKGGIQQVGYIQYSPELGPHYIKMYPTTKYGEHNDLVDMLKITRPYLNKYLNFMQMICLEFFKRDETLNNEKNGDTIEERQHFVYNLSKDVLTPRVGDIVTVKLERPDINWDRYYQGKVTAIDLNEVYSIDFNDGEKRNDITVDEILLFPGQIDNSPITTSVTKWLKKCEIIDEYIDQEIDIAENLPKVKTITDMLLDTVSYCKRAVRLQGGKKKKKQRKIYKKKKTVSKKKKFKNKTRKNK